MSQNKIKYSIIVPIYNCEKYLEKCILSLLNQDSNYKYEILLINDGSKDNSELICKKYSDNYSNIRYFYKDNSGVSDTRNFGLKNALGEYVLFCDSDDYIDNGFIQEIDKHIDKKYDLINFGISFDVVKKDGTVSSNIINYKEKEYISKEEIKNDFINIWNASMMYNVVNKVFKLDIINKYHLSFPAFNFGEDMDFCMNYMNHVDSFYNSNKTFYRYIREREGAATEKYRENFYELRKNEFIKMNEYFDKWQINKKDYYEFTCRRFSDRILGCIENVFCSNEKFNNKYNKIKTIINDKLTIESFKNTKNISMKNKILRVPIKLRLSLVTYIEMNIIHFIKTKCPSLFNKMKYKR